VRLLAKNRKVVVAALLIALGVVAFAYEGLLYATRRGDWEPGGPRAGSAASRHVPVPPVLGALSLVGGMALLFIASESVRRAPSLP
jgi:hypothetical protein